ncbi:Crp/Fnr family transcriptional regulator [Oceanospirillum beijerinckii]|uniref:Crp/Fnr family transcriptional regulator n=1 Tax=Oceanospirillum beijerinckii TaxID=64976 RepID=UPI000404897B|nr:Crp/Fnr family transcriptional regulator [Oceanospirillum beijerinckii]MAC47479.1 Crp/Fnr family transcriptional regulator [Oceanospirillum sp.]
MVHSVSSTPNNSTQLTSSPIADLVEHYPQVTLPAQHQVFSQGQVCENYIVVTAGKVKVFARSEDGREIVLYRIQPGEVCVLTTSCLMGNARYSAEGITETEVTAHIISQAEFNKLLASSEEFRQFVFHNFGHRLSDLMLQIEQIAFDSIEKRICQFICQHKDQNNTLNTTHQAIAEEIGSAREVVSRCLKKLEKQGVVELHRGSIKLLQPEALS